MDDFNFALMLKTISIAFIPMLLGIICHEVAHGYAALRCGDPTAAMLGRLTLNPIKHIDPMGLMVFVLTSLTSPFVFGWAKPVPINPRYFKDVRRDTILISLAGPLTNFTLAIGFALLLRLTITIFPHEVYQGSSTYEFFILMLFTGVKINFVLAWLNLLPIPPLDGSKILWGFLPAKLGYQYMQLERYGFIILILLLTTGALSKVLGPLVFHSVDLTTKLIIT